MCRGLLEKGCVGWDRARMGVKREGLPDPTLYTTRDSYPLRDLLSQGKWAPRYPYNAEKLASATLN